MTTLVSTATIAGLVPAICVLGVTWILGVWWGLWLAWTQPARMERWAAYAHRVQLRINEVEYEMKGIEK